MPRTVSRELDMECGLPLLLAAASETSADPAIDASSAWSEALMSW